MNMEPTTLFLVGFVLAFVLFHLVRGYLRIVRKAQAKALAEEEKWQQRREESARGWQKDMEYAYAHPVRCPICSEAAGKDVLQPFAYHCPKCGQHGLMSIYGGCTACANRARGL